MSVLKCVSDLKVVLPFMSAHKLEVIFFASAILFIYLFCLSDRLKVKGMLGKIYNHHTQNHQVGCEQVSLFIFMFMCKNKKKL